MSDDKQQKIFYSRNHNLWLGLSLLLLMLLSICGVALSEEKGIPSYLFVLGFIALMLLILTILSWNNDQKFRLNISTEGLKIGRNSVIPWKFIQSIKYVKVVTYTSPLTDMFMSDDVIASIVCGDVITIPLKKFCRKPLEIDDIQKCINQYFDAHEPCKNLLPELNQEIMYDQSVAMGKNNNFIISGGGFGIGMLGLGLILLLQIGLDILAVGFLLLGIVFIYLPYALPNKNSKFVDHQKNCFKNDRTRHSR